MVDHGQSEDAESEAQGASVAGAARRAERRGQRLEDVQPRTQVPRRRGLSGLLARRQRAARHRQEGHEGDEGGKSGQGCPGYQGADRQGQQGGAGCQGAQDAKGALSPAGSTAFEPPSAR